MNWLETQREHVVKTFAIKVRDISWLMKNGRGVGDTRMIETLREMVSLCEQADICAKALRDEKKNAEKSS